MPTSPLLTLFPQFPALSLDPVPVDQMTYSPYATHSAAPLIPVKEDGLLNNATAAAAFGYGPPSAAASEEEAFDDHDQYHQQSVVHDPGSQQYYYHPGAVEWYPNYYKPYYYDTAPHSGTTDHHGHPPAEYYNWYYSYCGQQQQQTQTPPPNSYGYSQYSIYNNAPPTDHPTENEMLEKHLEIQRDINTYFFDQFSYISAELVRHDTRLSMLENFVNWYS